MMKLDRAFGEQVEACVQQIELETDAEVVVVAARQSGSYADVPSHAALGVALLGLMLLSVSPWTVPPVAVVVDLLVVFGVARVLASHPRVVHSLTSQARKDRQVQQAADAEFHREAVHSTEQRTGLLVYVSTMEQQVVLVPDDGLEARIPRGRFAKAQAELAHHDLTHFLAGLRELGTLLADAVPRTEEGRQHLSDAPRIRP